eukprot:TRINITY_DN5106_c0_g1_i1.p1 TRINITY_DN5106_c0_g1~~TRINITY_DN5106_c0_g1_i1.p1  ORF type:complete len:411 (+),score=75.90 TRINITY_DN5106_c0_g1_i1:57-1289(+)
MHRLRLLNTGIRTQQICRKFHSTPARRVGSLHSFSEEEKLLKDTVARFAKEVIAPKVKKMDDISLMDPTIIRALFEQGLMGIETSATYGGNGMNFTSAILAIEEIAKVDPSVSVVVDVQNTLVSIPLRRWGTEEQQQKYLPRLCTDTVGCFCLSEWGSGSDAFALQTTARREGNSFVLNGTKAWITNSGESQFFIVFANVDHSMGYKGITAFIVTKHNTGIKIGKRENKLGLRASSTCEVNLVNCVVSEQDVLGEVGKGYKYAIETLNEGRIGIAAQMCGLAQGALDHTIPYLMQRKQFGQTIASFQGVRFDYAWLATEIEAARLLTYNAARLQEEGKPFTKEAAMAKLFSSEVATRVASKCVEMLGGVGFTKDFPVEKYYRDCKIGQIYEGTTNIQLETIGKLVVKEYE